MSEYFKKIEDAIPEVKVDFSEVTHVMDELIEKQVKNVEECIDEPLEIISTKEYNTRKLVETNTMLWQLSKVLGKNNVEIAQTKAFQKNVYYRRLNVAALDKANTNDKAREAACAVSLDSDPRYQELTAALGLLEAKNEDLKADVTYYKIQVLMYLGLLGVSNPGSVFGLYSEIK